jgi:AraC-like DNA-binding protein
MPASWRALTEIPGACVIRIDEAVECARLLVGGYLLLAPLGPAPIGRYRVHGEEVAVRAGRTQLREPGDVHLTLDRRSGTLRGLWLPAGHVEAVARELGWRTAPHWRALAVDDEALFAAQRRLHAALEGEEPIDLRASLHALVVAALERHGDRGPHAGRSLRRELVTVRDHLQAHINSNVTLDELAELDGISKYHLARMFTDAFGVPPHAYQILLRVNAARALLDAGVEIVEASARVGFADQAHLTRHFKKAFSVTPGQYLRDLAPGPR